MGKSFIMRMFIKEQVMSGTRMNFCVVVPTKALINEVQHKLIADLDKLLEQQGYTIVTSGNSLALEKKQKYIFVLTPERLLYLLIEKKNIHIDLLFVDEAHKISAYDSRSTFYYQDIALLSERSRKPRVVFSSPNIPNPEIYLKLIPGIMEQDAKGLATSYSPVSQVKYIVDFQAQTLSQFNSVSGTSTQILSIKGLTFCALISKLNQVKPNGRKPQSIIYSNSTAKVVHLAQEYADHFQSLNNAVLERLAKDIENEVHADYYLARVVRKGIAYQIGYLPSTLRTRIEEQFCEGNIHTLFCTSTLVEGVNLPADNLFITSQYNGLKKLKNVDFMNLVGRVGRIEFNLYGNAFLVRLDDDKRTSPQQYEKLLSEPVPLQKLSIVAALTKPQKQRIRHAVRY
jgi:replicative superfamily II helicase